MDDNKKKLFEVLKENQNEILFLRNYDDERYVYGKITKFPDDETGKVEYRTVTLETFRPINDFVTGRVHLHVNEEENTVSEFIDRVIHFREPGSKRYDIEDYIVDILNAQKVSYEPMSIDYKEFATGHYQM